MPNMKRASSSASAFSRAKDAAPVQLVTATPDDGSSDGTPSQRHTVTTASKYTVLLDQQHADHLDQLLLRARHEAGRDTSKSDLIRALIRITADDPTIEQRVLGEIGHN